MSYTYKLDGAGIPYRVANQEVSELMVHSGDLKSFNLYLIFG